MLETYKKYIRRNHLLRARAEAIGSRHDFGNNWEAKYLSIGLANDAWQSWCDFCRNVILLSCAGCATKSGSIVPPRFGINTWNRIGYEAGVAIKGGNCHATKVINFRRHEPTWGDQNHLLPIIRQLQPNNYPTLTTGFGLPMSAPKHLQIVRNACAHLNPETRLDINAIVPFYIGSDLKHPIDLIWWLEPNTKTEAIYDWLEEFELVAQIVTS